MGICTEGHLHTPNYRHSFFLVFHKKERSTMEEDTQDGHPFSLPRYEFSMVPEHGSLSREREHPLVGTCAHQPLCACGNFAGRFLSCHIPPWRRSAIRFPCATLQAS